MKVKRHGLSGHKLYGVHSSMKQRCYNPNNNAYKNYGARGIRVCDEWINDFLSFYKWSLENGYKEGLTIDRINNAGNYSPDNCRFVDRKIQNNNRRGLRKITYMKETLTVTEWCNRLKMDYSTYKQRVRNGMSPYEAISTPVKKYDEVITSNGTSMKVSDWCKEVGIKNNTYHSRISKLGWSKEKACTTPYIEN